MIANLWWVFSILIDFVVGLERGMAGEWLWKNEGIKYI